MTTLYLDTEFNGYGGELISLALYNPAKMNGFYEVIAIPQVIQEGVDENVIPKLGKEAIGRRVFRDKLRDYLKRFPNLVIVADWPADFQHFFAQIMREGHWEVDIPLRAELINSGEVLSQIPHNAYADAKALAEWHIDHLVGSTFKPKPPETA